MFDRELGSEFRFGTAAVAGLKATLPKVGGKVHTFNMYKIRFQAYAGHLGCMAAFLSEREILVGGPKFSDAWWLSQGYSNADIRMHNMVWTCLAESITDGVVLCRVRRGHPVQVGKSS